MVKDEGYKESKQGETKKNRRMRVKGRRERGKKSEDESEGKERGRKYEKFKRDLIYHLAT